MSPPEAGAPKGNLEDGRKIAPNEVPEIRRSIDYDSSTWLTLTAAISKTGLQRKPTAANGRLLAVQIDDFRYSASPTIGMT